MRSGPAWGRGGRAQLCRAALACLLPIGFGVPFAAAQTVTADLFSPQRDALVAPPDLLQTGVAAPDASLSASGSTAPSAPDETAPSLADQDTTYGLPAADAGLGFDPLSRKRRQKKYYPGEAKPKPSPGPGTPPPSENSLGELRLSIPSSERANKPPIAPAMAGAVIGQPPRRRLKPDDDPFGAVGDYVGSFLVKSAVELYTGYDSNPGRIYQPHGLPFWVVAPEFLAVSDWDRNALVADLRGSFTGYGGSLPATIDGVPSPAPTNVSRPDFNGHVDGRLDVSKNTDITAEARLLVSTDNPGSPTIEAGLAGYPIYTTLGGTVGFDQKFNRLQIYGGAMVDRTAYQNSTLTDGTTASNDDRDFNQYGGVARASYEVMPGLKPFVEVEGDTRVHDLQFDRDGFERDSTGGYASAGTSFEFTQLLTGEFSIGWAERNYVDPKLDRLQGLLTKSSLVWSATPVTTAKFSSDTQIDETTLPGSSGTLVHTYAVEVDHDFRRWLTAIGKFSYGTFDYQGIGRSDKTYSTEGDLIYKMTRNLWIKGSLSYDVLASNVPLSSSKATVVMLGVRVQN
ncbi:MAG: outer membrane beta-barrel protein [Bradyrhizobium sp.]